MKEAYLITIRDFEIALRNLKWWEFKRASQYRKEIKKYETLLNNLQQKENSQNKNIKT